MSNGPRWPDELVTELRRLRAQRPPLSFQQIGKLIGRPTAGVRAKLTALGLTGEDFEFSAKLVREASDRFGARRAGNGRPPRDATDAGYYTALAAERRKRVALALDILREKHGTTLSHTRLARALGMSQAAVTRAIKRLQTEAPNA